MFLVQYNVLMIPEQDHYQLISHFVMIINGTPLINCFVYRILNINFLAQMQMREIYLYIQVIKVVVYLYVYQRQQNQNNIAIDFVY